MAPWIDDQDALGAGRLRVRAAIAGRAGMAALLERLGQQQARVTLWEGRYHQIKRMFHRVGNRVVSLHREAIGPLRLPEDLASGKWRFLTETEVQAVWGVKR
jgi:pseudouridine synthase